MVGAKQNRVYGDRLVTPRARLAFPYLFQPDTQQDGKPKFKCTLLFDPTDETVKATLKKMKAECLKIAKEAFGKTEGVKLPFRDGNEKADKYDGFSDHVFITASTTRRPGVVGADPKEPIAMESDIYGGCYVRASLVPATYMMGGNPGVSFYLNNVQKLDEGERFGGGGSNPEADFEAVESEHSEETSYEDEDTLGF